MVSLNGTKTLLTYFSQRSLQHVNTSNLGLRSFEVLPTELRYKIYQMATKSEKKNDRIKVYVELQNDSRTFTFWIPQAYKASFLTLFSLQLVSKTIAAEAVPDYVKTAVMQVDLERWNPDHGAQPASSRIRKVIEKANNLLLDIWDGLTLAEWDVVDPDANRSLAYMYPLPPAIPQNVEIDAFHDPYLELPPVWENYLSYEASIPRNTDPADLQYILEDSDVIPPCADDYTYYCASISWSSESAAWEVKGWERCFCEDKDPNIFWAQTVGELEKAVEGATVLPYHTLFGYVENRMMVGVEDVYDGGYSD